MHPASRKIFKILNVKTGEIYTLKSCTTSMTYITRIIVLLLKGKYGESIVLSDGEFQNCFSYNS